MPGGNLKEFGDIMTNCSYPSSRSRMSAASFVGLNDMPPHPIEGVDTGI
jgi:hypothetical protein